MLSFRSIILLLVPLAAVRVSAAPTPDTAPVVDYINVFPEIKVAPWLPSLESMNLTSADLYKMGPPEHLTKTLEARYKGSCGPEERHYVNVDDVIALYHWFNQWTEMSFQAGDGNGDKEFSRCWISAGYACIMSQALDGSDTDAFGTQIAGGILWTIDHCTKSKGAGRYTAGKQAATNKPNWIVIVRYVANPDAYMGDISD